jgi:hypothetical protein
MALGLILIKRRTLIKTINSSVKMQRRFNFFAEFSNSERLSEQLSKKLGRKVDIKKKKKKGEKWFWEQKMKNLFQNEMIRQKK